MHTPESGDGLFQDLSVYEKESRVGGQKHNPFPSGRKKTHTTKRQHSTRKFSWKKSGKGDYLQDSQGDDDLPVESFLSYIEIKEAPPQLLQTPTSIIYSSYGEKAGRDSGCT